MTGAIKQFGRKTFSSLAVRNYRLYFIGQGISQCGTWMQTVALGWLVLTLSGSGTELGSVLALQFIPLLVAAPWGGVIVDKLNKRRILYWTQSILASISLLIAVLVFTHTIHLWVLYITAFINGCVKVLDNPARQTFISDLVGNEHVKNAISLNSTMVNLARVIGPTIAGVLIAVVGIAFCFFIDFISFAAVLIMLTRMQGKELDRVPDKHAKAPKISDGFRYVRSVPLLSTTLIMMAIIGTFAYEFTVSLPIFAKQTFLGDATTYALLTSAFGAGSAVGGLIAAGRHEIKPRHLLFFAFFFGAAMIGVSLAPTLPFALVGMLIVGFFSINVTSLANTMIQLESRPDMRGRVMALWNMAIFGSTPIGGPIIGWVGDHIGARYSLALGGISTIIAALFAAAILSKRYRLPPLSPQIELASEAADNVKL